MVSNNFKWNQMMPLHVKGLNSSNLERLALKGLTMKICSKFGVSSVKTKQHVTVQSSAFCFFIYCFMSFDFILLTTIMILVRLWAHRVSYRISFWRLLRVPAKSVHSRQTIIRHVTREDAGTTASKLVYCSQTFEISTHDASSGSCHVM